jgi:hypothetical protein
MKWLDSGGRTTSAVSIQCFFLNEGAIEKTLNWSSTYLARTLSLPELDCGEDGIKFRALEASTPDETA